MIAATPGTDHYGLDGPGMQDIGAVAIFAGVRGYLDSIEVRDIGRFEQGLLEEFHNNHSDILTTIRTEGELSDETDKKIAEIMDQYAKTFAA